MVRILYYKRFYFILGAVFCILSLYSILRLQISEEGYKVLLKGNHYQPTVNSYQSGDRTIGYCEIGEKDKPLLILLHGSPSSSASWLSLFEDSSFLSKVNILAIDRPGYGFSGLGNIETSIATQANYIAPLIKEKVKGQNKVMVLGSSYGGPVAAKLAMDLPEVFDGLYLMSASVQPTAEKIYDISYPTSHWTLSWAVPAIFRVANAEKLSHKEGLQEIQEGWKNIKAKTTIFHGNNDDLIYYSNAVYAYDQLVNARSKKLITVEKGEHGMLWSKTKLVKQQILKAIQRL